MHLSWFAPRTYVERGWRQDATLANSECCLTYFKYVTIGHDRVGALVVEGFNYINHLPPLVCFFIANQRASPQTLSRFFLLIQLWCISVNLVVFYICSTPTMIRPNSETACPSERILSHHVHESAIPYSPNASSLLRCVTYIMGDKRVMPRCATTGGLRVVQALRPFPVKARAGLTKSPKTPSCR